jgi:cytochrome c553
MKQLVCLAVLLAAAVVVSGRLLADDKGKDAGKPKYKIEAIMEKVHKGGETSLRNKTLAGKVSKEELAILVEYYTELGKNTPPKGDKASWKKKTDAVLAAAKKVAANPKDEAALKAYGKATNCTACHEVHKADE